MQTSPLKNKIETESKERDSPRVNKFSPFDSKNGAMNPLKNKLEKL